MKRIPFRNCLASLRKLKPSSTLRKAALVLFSIALLLVGVAAVRAQTALDSFNPNANEQVFVIVVQPDGKILIGGRFGNISGENHNRLVRLNPDGTLDSEFKHPDVDAERHGTVYAVAVQADGKILVGGDFTTINGETRNFIARLNSDGTLDSTFLSNDRAGVVLSIAVQADGKILVGGRIRNNWFFRLNSDGTEDATFNVNVYYDVRAIVIQPDGKILIGGDFTKINGDPTRKHLARLNTNGTVDPTFNPILKGTTEAYGGRVQSIALQADGKILIGGFFTSIGGVPRNYIARLNATTGLVDAPDSFDPQPSGVIESIVVQADGKILVGGLSFTSIGKQSRNSIARLNPDGTADSFDPNAANATNNPRVYSIAVQADGKILVGGDFTTLAPNGGPAVTRNYIARLEAEVRLDALNLGMVGNSVLATAVQPDGKILIGGDFSKVLGVERNNIARLNTDGTLDLDFNPNANGSVEAIALQADGSILVGGDFRSNNRANSIGGKPRNRIARLLASGAADSFDPNADQSVRCIAVQADGNILVGGRFTTLAPNGGTAVTRNYIARLKPDGMLDTFNPNANGIIYSIAVQPDSVAVPVAERGKILVGGGFTTLQPNGATSATTRHYVARLKADGALDPDFNPNANDAVFSIAVQADDGKILAGGLFSGLNSIGGNSGETRNYIARLSTDGKLDNALPFNPDADNAVVTIAVQSDRKIVVGGYFTGIGGQKRMGIARLNAIDGLADSFNLNANWLVYSTALQADGKILAGGFFTTIDGQPRYLFARLTNDTAAPQYMNVLSPTAVGWAREGSSPEVTRVTFESSTDNVNYTLLGSGTASGSRWVLEGLSLPTGNIYIRARGYYRSGSGNGSESINESVRSAVVTPQATQAINLSTRMRVETADNVGIGGFIITGSAPKHVLLRAIGPSLTQFGVPNVLADPVMELHGPTGFVTITDDNWTDDSVQQALIRATGIVPTNNLESAIDATLTPGAYTAIIRGNGNTSGVASVEVYDLDHEAVSRLANISTRAFVSTGSDIVIAGFILGRQGGNDRIVLRGIGPSLTALSMPDALANPTLELRDGNGALRIANDNWADDPVQAAQLTAAGLAPTNQLESAISATLPAGLYTVLLAGKNNGAGVGLVEVYDLGAP